MDVYAQIDAIVARLKAASYNDRESIKDELLAFGREHNSDSLRGHLETARKGVSLEVRWEIDEVIEALTPPPPPPPEPPPAEEAPPVEEEETPTGQLKMSDLKEVYADPRGIWLFTDKTGKRWFLEQMDPATRQPVMMELNPTEIERVKAQLKGSPYWRLGSGVIP